MSVTTGPTLALAGIEAVVGGCAACREASPANLFAGCDRLPTFMEAADLLVTEAMARAGGNQTLAARLLGISQPALSKRLKSRRNADVA